MLRMAARIALLGSAVLAHAGDSTQLGGKDFYPSARHPVGFRGDGNGWFAGATPVTEWWDGTPGEVPMTGPSHERRTIKGYGWVLTDDRATNIVWRVRMPSWANSQPIVVGDKVFSYGEPDLLFCNDAHTGRLLWQRAVNPWLAAGLPPDIAATCRNLSGVYQALKTFAGMQFHFQTCGRYIDTADYDRLATLLLEEDAPGIRAQLKAIDPEGHFEAAATNTFSLFRDCIGDPKVPYDWSSPSRK